MNADEFALINTLMWQNEEMRVINKEILVQLLNSFMNDKRIANKKIIDLVFKKQ